MDCTTWGSSKEGAVVRGQEASIGTGGRSSRRERARPRRVGLVAAVVALAAAGALWLAGALPASQPVAPRTAAQHGLTLSALPLTAQGVASSAVGAGDPAYHVASSADGLRARNSAQHLQAGFTAAGVEVRAGGANVRMA